MGARKVTPPAEEFPGGLEWFETVNGDRDAQCARCGSSVGVLDIHDYESVELFCMSRPEWCAQNPIKGRSHVRGAHFPIDTDITQGSPQ